MPPKRIRTEAMRIRDAERYAANREMYKAKAAKWYAENHEQARATQAAYADSHREQVTKLQRDWYVKNRERIAAQNAERRVELTAYQKAYRRADPVRHQAAEQKRRAKKKGSPVCDLTRQQWESIKAAYGHRCVYCGVKSKRLTQDHLLSLHRGGSHTASNIVPACNPCNSRKHAGPPLVPVQPVLLV